MSLWNKTPSGGSLQRYKGVYGDNSTAVLLSLEVGYAIRCKHVEEMINV